MDVYRALKTGEPYVDEGAEAVFQRNSAGRQKSARALSWFAKSFRFLWCSPMHPRTRKMAAEFGFKFDGIKVIESLGFLEFLQLEANVRLVLTDSGGVQEETCILGVLCVTLRDNTERPETLEVGANLLTGRRCKK
jgi:UDP-N-acetylglucosamine 2-epimerase (non-hydrolysing)